MSPRAAKRKLVWKRLPKSIDPANQTSSLLDYESRRRLEAAVREAFTSTRAARIGMRRSVAQAHLEDTVIGVIRGVRP